MLPFLAHLYALGLPAILLGLVGWLVTRPQWTNRVASLRSAIVSLISATSLSWLAKSLGGLSTQAQHYQLQWGPWAFVALSCPLAWMGWRMRTNNKKCDCME